MIGAATDPEAVEVVGALGADWVRVNYHLGGKQSDVAMFLDAGIGVVVTVSNRDPGNAVTTYGTPAEYPNSGYPFRSRAEFQRGIRRLLESLRSRLRAGGEVWVQCENEIADASVYPKSRFWRGTLDQYVTQLDACYEAVKSVDGSIPVVAAGFASQALDRAREPTDPLHDVAARLLEGQLERGRYDAVDLHFYGCVEDIPAKVAWVEERMHGEARWISTEDGGPDARCARTPGRWTDAPEAFEQLQAEQIPARLAACADAGGSVCLWFSLVDLEGESYVFDHLGLIDRRGGTARLKPSYDAFRDFVAGRAT